MEGFSGTKDFGIGKCIKSSTFRAGEHCWYIECYPCGVDEERAGRVCFFLCLSDRNEQVEAGCIFTLMTCDRDGHLIQEIEINKQDYESKHTFNADTLWRCGITDDTERGYLESCHDDDCLLVRCDVYLVREFRAVPPPDLHRPLSDLLASGMPAALLFQFGGELFTVHRGVPGPSAHIAASPTSAGASSSTVGRISSGSHVLTIDGRYSKTKKMFLPDDFVESEYFVVGGRRWLIQLYPSSEKENDHTSCLAVYLCYCPDEDQDKDEVVKVRFELTLLTFAREIISSAQFCYAAFTRTNDSCGCYFPFNTKMEEPHLGDSFHVKCDVTVVEEIAPMRPPELHLHFGHLLASQVGTDVEFEVGDELFSSHKCVLATRSTAFMAEFFGSAAKGSSTAVTRVQIDDMEPRVFKALLHFIYTDTLPEVQNVEEKFVMAQGLLVAADRYAMGRLKLICGDMLCSYINNAHMAITTLDLADKHGCRRLREACKKFLMDHFTKAAP